MKINKITGKQIVSLEQIKQMNEEILNNRETIADLYPVFMRTQIMKKEWPKKDEKFSVLEDMAECEIELPDTCKRIIDFTRCSYSV